MTVLVIPAGLTAFLCAWKALRMAVEYACGTVHVTVPNPLTTSTRLDAIVSDMRTLGRPSVRAVRAGDEWHLVEGSHRVRAALVLGLGVELVEVSRADPIPGHDWPTIEGDARRRPDASVGELLDSATRCGRCELPARRVHVRRLGWRRAVPACVYG